jgi:hypothetical protein
LYFRLTEALKRRFILELRHFWSTHPKYKDLVNNIQGKYSFDERPQHGIIVKTSGGNHVILSPDHYVGVVESYAYLTRMQNYPGVAIEWVREDPIAIQNNKGEFPSPSGVYYIELTGDEEFYIDPLYDVRHEQVTMLSQTHGQTQRPFLKGTLRLYEAPSGFLLIDGAGYTSDPQTGVITLTSPLTGGRWLSADYRYPGASSGPHVIYPMHANNTAIPGVVLAFGHRNGKGDRLAVVVQNTREAAALEYGGQWSLSLDFDVMARDVFAQQEILDFSVMYIMGVLRSRLSTEGIEMQDISLGGESEEVYDENGDDYFYNASFSLTVQTEWSIHVPLGPQIRRVLPITTAQEKSFVLLTDDEIAKVNTNIQLLESLGLEAVSDPFFTGRTETFETIK